MPRSSDTSSMVARRREAARVCDEKALEYESRNGLKEAGIPVEVAKAYRSMARVQRARAIRLRAEADALELAAGGPDGRQMDLERDVLPQKKRRR